MVHTAEGDGLHQDEQPTSLKYHIIQSGGSDYYLTTNPNQKHINDPIGPSYYVRVSTASSNGFGEKSYQAAVDAPNDSDGSFSITIFVHDYDNVSVSMHSNDDDDDDDDEEQSINLQEQNGLLVPIMHIRRIDGESKMAVTVIDNGENIWETIVALHRDPYSGESKFVFLDPWERRWSLSGKDGIKCTSSLGDEPISTLEKKVLADSKIGWITLERPALKMLDVMVGVNMAVYCFRTYEFNPSRLTAIATGILHADLNTTKASQASARGKKSGFRMGFIKKKQKERGIHSNYSNKTQREKEIVDPSLEPVRRAQTGLKTVDQHRRQPPELTRRDVMPVANQSPAKYQPKSTMRSNRSFEGSLPAQPQSGNPAPTVRRPSQQSGGHMGIRPDSGGVDQQTPSTDTEGRYPRIPAIAQTAGVNKIPTVPRTPSLQPEIPRDEIPPALPSRPTKEPYQPSLHGDSKNGTDILPQRRYPSTVPPRQGPGRPNVIPTDPPMPTDIHRRSMFVSSMTNTSASPTASQGPRPRPNSMILPESASPNGNRANPSHQSAADKQKENSLRPNSQATLPASKSPGDKKNKNRLSMISVMSRFNR
ncbi:hypothetical protein V1509DRAFT_631284 [Lipomyces kononenkoae]